MLKSRILATALLFIIALPLVLIHAAPTTVQNVSATGVPRGISHNTFFRNGQAWVFYKTGSNLAYEFTNDGSSFQMPANSPMATDVSNSTHMDVYYDPIEDACWATWISSTNNRAKVTKGYWNDVDADWDWEPPEFCRSDQTQLYPHVITDNVNNKVLVSFASYGGAGYYPRTYTSALDLSGGWSAVGFPYWDSGGLAAQKLLKFDNGTIFCAYYTFDSPKVYGFVVKWSGTAWGFIGTVRSPGTEVNYNFYNFAGFSETCQVVFDVSEINGVLWVTYQKTSGDVYRQRRASTSQGAEEVVVSGLTVGGSSVILTGSNSSYQRLTYTESNQIKFKLYTGSWGAAQIWISEPTLEEKFFTASHNGTAPYTVCSWSITSTSNDVRFDSFGTVPFNCPVNVSVEIADPETTGISAGNWVFAQERFYNFSCLIYHRMGSDLLDTFWLGFNDTVNFSSIIVDISEGDFRVDAGSQEPILIRTQTGSMLLSGSQYLYINVPVWFADKIQDAYGNDKADLWMKCNDTNGLDTGWQEMESNYMSIYNKGGFNLEYTTSGTAYRIDGGDIFEFYSSDAAYVYSDYIWRNLQHVKFLVDAESIVGYPSFDVRYGMDFCLATENWIRGWELKLHAVDCTYPSVIGGGNKHFTWNATWYYNQAEVRTDTIYMFHQGEIAAVGETTYTRFWVDLWFNQVNASSFFGGRVNAYAYPVKDGAAWYMRWLSTNWGVDENLPKESMFFGELQDDDGNVVHANNIKLVKLWAKLQTYHVASDIQEVRLFRYEVFDKTMCNPPLLGIPTPTFEETKVPVMPQGGFVGAIVSALMAMGKWLADNILWGGLGIFPALVGFLDTIAAIFGAPHFFSNLFTWIGNGLSYLTTSITYFFELVVQLFLLLSSVMGSFVYILTQLVLSFVNTINGIGSLMSGAVGAGGNLWNSLGLSTWIIVGLVFYPLYLLILWEEEGSEPVLAQLSLIFGLGVGLFHLFAGVIGLVANLIFGLIESIPIAE